MSLNEVNITQWHLIYSIQHFKLLLHGIEHTFIWYLVRKDSLHNRIPVRHYSLLTLERSEVDLITVSICEWYQRTEMKILLLSLHCMTGLSFVPMP